MYQNYQLLQLLKSGFFFWHDLFKNIFDTAKNLDGKLFISHDFKFFFNPANQILLSDIRVRYRPRTFFMGHYPHYNWRNSNQRFPSLCILYNLRNLVYQAHSSQDSIVYNVVPRGIFAPLNWYVTRYWAQIFLIKVCKKTVGRAEKCTLSQSRYSKF